MRLGSLNADPASKIQTHFRPIIHGKLRVTIWRVIRARVMVMWVTIWYLTMNYFSDLVSRIHFHFQTKMVKIYILLQNGSKTQPLGPHKPTELIMGSSPPPPPPPPGVNCKTFPLVFGV